MKIFSFFRNFWGSKSLYLKEADELLPLIQRERQQEIERLFVKIEALLKILREIIDEKHPISIHDLRVLLINLFDEVRELLNHLLSLTQSDFLLAQRLEELEKKIMRRLNNQQLEPPLVTKLSKIDIEDQGWLEKEIAILGEIKNVLGLPVPDILVFTPQAWETCIKEEIIKKGTKTLPYKLKSELKEIIKSYSVKNAVKLRVFNDLNNLSLKAQGNLEAITSAYIALLTRALKRNLSPQSILVWEDIPITSSGEFYTSSPDSPHLSLVVFGEDICYLSKNPSFDNLSENSLSLQDKRSFLIYSFILEHFFGFPLHLKWIKTKSGQILFYDVKVLKGINPEIAHEKVLTEGGIVVYHGVVTGQLSLPKKYLLKDTILMIPKGEDIISVLSESIQGVLLEEGHPQDFIGHLCQQLKIPALCQVKGFRQLSEGAIVTLDTYHRKIYQGGSLEKPLFLPFQGKGIEAAKGYRRLRKLVELIFSEKSKEFSIEQLIKTSQLKYYDIFKKQR
ncbi:hypothetical protein [Thermodesulfatator atlanticus]|uniref:hypothetical protein n=1 Tax=Thermodesulfatator atlanticus TaxID=501497 RepID=UPI0003B57B03|nr:hypothetical protein [Thermodesulfatator atlanticus]